MLAGRGNIRRRGLLSVHCRFQIGRVLETVLPGATRHGDRETTSEISARGLGVVCLLAGPSPRLLARERNDLPVGRRVEEEAVANTAYYRPHLPHVLFGLSIYTGRSPVGRKRRVERRQQGTFREGWDPHPRRRQRQKAVGVSASVLPHFVSQRSIPSRGGHGHSV